MVYINPLLSTSGLTPTQLGVTALAANIAATVARLVIGPIADGTKYRHVVFFMLSFLTAIFILSFFAFPLMIGYLYEGTVYPDGLFYPRVVWKANGTLGNFSEPQAKRICWPRALNECELRNNGTSIGNFELTFHLNDDSPDPSLVKYTLENATLTLSRYSNSTSTHVQVLCQHETSQNVEPCIKLQNSVPGTAPTSIFLLAIFLRSLVIMSHSSLPNLLDSTTYGILGEENTHMYGRSRAFGSAGYVAAALSTGFCISSMSSQLNPSMDHLIPTFASIQPNDQVTPNYKPCLILGSVFAFLGAIIGGIPYSELKPLTIKLRKAILIGIQSPDMIKCSINSFLAGLIYSYMFEYYFYVLTSEYHVPPYFMGILVVSVIIGEVPAFFVAGSLVKRFGATICIAIAHILFGLRVLSFAIFTNYFCYIVSEIVCTTGFSLLYTALIIQAGSAGRGVQAETGDVVASMHALMNAILFGMTSCIGGLMWGLLLDQFTGRQLFYAASASAFILSVFTPLIAYMVDMCFHDPQNTDVLTNSSHILEIKAAKNGHSTIYVDTNNHV